MYALYVYKVQVSMKMIRHLSNGLHLSHNKDLFRDGKKCSLKLFSERATFMLIYKYLLSPIRNFRLLFF